MESQMSAGDEDSFIILGNTPSLFDSFASIQSPHTNNHSILSNVSATENKDKSIEADLIANTSNNPNVWNVNSSSPNTSLSNNSIKRNSLQPSLAESFLLGSIDCDTMKTSILSNFPSLIGSETKAEDVQKLQSLVQEHSQLKENLEQSNVSMRQQFTMINGWHETIKGIQESHQNEMSKFVEINEELVATNSALNRQIDELQEVAKQCSQKANSLNQSQSVSNEEIENLKEKIQHLELELSKAIADKLEFEDTRQNYIDEIDCIKVNFVATEELYKQARAESLEFKAENLTLKQEVEKLRKEIDEQKHEMSLVQAQADIYKVDFEAERSSRQQLAGEKDQLLSDIRVLQKRNQALIETQDAVVPPEAVARAITESQSKRPIQIDLTATKRHDPYNPKYTCPVCGKEYDTVDEVERHVNACLEKGEFEVI